MKDFKIFNYEEFIDCKSVKEFVDTANQRLNTLSLSQSHIGERVINLRDYTGWKQVGNCSWAGLDEHIAKGGKAYEAMVIGIRDIKTKTERVK